MTTPVRSTDLRHDPRVDDARQQLAPYLLPDETLLWTGRPDPSRHLDASDLFLVPFSLLWGGSVISFEVGALAQGDASLALFGIPFVVIGLFLIAGRFLVKARQKRSTVYGLTAARALVATGSTSFREAPVRRTPVGRRRSRDGRHLTVTFGATSSWAANTSYANTGLDVFGTSDGPLAFYDVADVTGLQAALRALPG